tara:strand:+ start:2261 stop:2548 length:288 start_codon:yes stop_codon:yes gene_type:complete
VRVGCGYLTETDKGVAVGVGAADRRNAMQFLTNWKTTLGGIGSLLAGLTMVVALLQGDGGDGVSWSIAIGLISAGAANIFGRDADKTSAQSGAGK